MSHTYRRRVMLLAFTFNILNEEANNNIHIYYI